MPNWSNFNILIAEDEEANFVLIQRWLRPTNANVFWAKDGEQAVKNSQEHNYNLIVMDIKMPNMDGLTATEIIKKGNKQLPIIIQSAFCSSEVIKQAYSAGCDNFINKPSSKDDFISMVSGYLIA